MNQQNTLCAMWFFAGLLIAILATAGTPEKFTKVVWIVGLCGYAVCIARLLKPKA